MDSAVSRSVAGSILLLLLLSLPLYLVRLGRTGLSEPDEPYYAIPAQEMMTTGTYDVPLFHGQPWFDKPILFYWIVMTSFLLFGVSEASARIGSVLAAAGGLLAVFALGRRVCRHPMRSEEHTSELQSQSNLVCRLLLEKKKIHATQRTPRSRRESHTAWLLADAG